MAILNKALAAGGASATSRSSVNRLNHRNKSVQADNYFVLPRLSPPSIL
jgi:hypothetical protein